MHEKDVVCVVDSAKLEYIRLRMYKFTKETLRSTEAEAQISAHNATDAVRGIETSDETDEERAERMRLSIHKFCMETLKLSEEEAQHRAMDAAFCGDILVLEPGARAFFCSLPRGHSIDRDHENSLGTKKWRESFRGQRVTFSK